jgi:hypothetical protein
MIHGETWVGFDIDVKGDIYEGLLQKNAQNTKGRATFLRYQFPQLSIFLLTSSQLLNHIRTHALLFIPFCNA